MSPMNLADYHPDWPAISRQIRDQAGNVCEFCGAPNGAAVYRYGGSSEWVRVQDATTFPRPMPVTIVLTVAHLCHDTTCYDPTHLRALCQRCHLRYDAEHHQRNAVETRRQRTIERGQGVLL